MLTYVAMSMAAISILAQSASGGQTLILSNQKTSRQALAGDQTDTGDICISIRHVYERIRVGKGKEQIEIILGGGACEPGPPISDLSVGHVAEDAMEDVVEAKYCPVYQKRIAELWFIRQHGTIRRARIEPVRAGDFFIIADAKHIFDLESLKGRRAAAQWIRRTLIDVDSCWNNFRRDKTRFAVGDLQTLLARDSLVDRH